MTGDGIKLILPGALYEKSDIVEPGPEAGPAHGAIGQLLGSPGTPCSAPKPSRPRRRGDRRPPLPRPRHTPRDCSRHKHSGGTRRPGRCRKPAPANVRTDGPVGDLIKLANAGVEPLVLLAFATNCGSSFNLNAEEIIYLKDLGVPSAVVTAILEHDKALKELPADSNAPLPPPPDWQSVPQPAAPAAANLAPPPQPAPPAYPPPQDLLAAAGRGRTRLLRCPVALRQLGSGRGRRALLATLGRSRQPLLAALLRRRPMGLYRLRMVLGFGLFVGLGAVSLRALASPPTLGLVLGAR